MGDEYVGKAVEESAVDDQEQAEAQNPDVGDGSPDTAPDVSPKQTLQDRIRAALHH